MQLQTLSCLGRCLITRSTLRSTRPVTCPIGVGLDLVEKPWLQLHRLVRLAICYGSNWVGGCWWVWRMGYFDFNTVHELSLISKKNLTNQIFKHDRHVLPKDGRNYHMALLVEVLRSSCSWTCSRLPRSRTTTQYSVTLSYRLVLREVTNGQWRWWTKCTGPTWSNYLSVQDRKPLLQRYGSLGSSNMWEWWRLKSNKRQYMKISISCKQHLSIWDIPIKHATQFRAPFEFSFHLGFRIPTFVFG